MSGARRGSPAVNGGAKAQAATQLQFSAPPRTGSSASPRSSPKKTSPKKRIDAQQRQQQQQATLPANSLNVRLGRALPAQTRHDGHGGKADGLAAVDRSEAVERQPRRINPQQLQRPGPPQALRSASGTWPLPGAQAPLLQRASSTAWPAVAAGRPAASPSQPAPPLAFGVMRTASSHAAAMPTSDGEHTSAAVRNSALDESAASGSSSGNLAGEQRGAAQSASGGAGAAAGAATAPPSQALDSAERLRQAGRLGTLYGHSLRRCSGVALAPELDLLLQLLALPAGLQLADAAPQPLLDSTQAAIAFATAAWAQAGGRCTVHICKQLQFRSCSVPQGRHRWRLFVFAIW